MILLDSCIVIEIQRGNSQIINDIYHFQQADIFVTPIVIAEFYRGARDKNELAKCKKLIEKFKILSINDGVTNCFSEIFENFSLSHRPSVPDMLIASTSLHYDIPLFTLNKRDFQFIPGIILHQV